MILQTSSHNCALERSGVGRLVLRLEVNLVAAAGKIALEALVKVEQLRSIVDPVAG